MKAFAYFKSTQPLYEILNITTEIKKSCKCRNTNKSPLMENVTAVSFEEIAAIFL